MTISILPRARGRHVLVYAPVFFRRVQGDKQRFILHSFIYCHWGFGPIKAAQSSNKFSSNKSDEGTWNKTFSRAASSTSTSRRPFGHFTSDRTGNLSISSFIPSPGKSVCIFNQIKNVMVQLWSGPIDGPPTVPCIQQARFTGYFFPHFPRHLTNINLNNPRFSIFIIIQQQPLVMHF